MFVFAVLILSVFLDFLWDFENCPDNVLYIFVFHFIRRTRKRGMLGNQYPCHAQVLTMLLMVHQQLPANQTGSGCREFQSVNVNIFYLINIRCTRFGYQANEFHWIKCPSRYKAITNLKKKIILQI